MHFTITKLVREIEGKLILTYRRAAPESDGTLILSAGRAYSFVFSNRLNVVSDTIY